VGVHSEPSAREEVQSLRAPFAMAADASQLALPFRMTPMTGCITNEPNTTGATSVARTNVPMLGTRVEVPRRDRDDELGGLEPAVLSAALSANAAASAPGMRMHTVLIRAPVIKGKRLPRPRLSHPVSLGRISPRAFFWGICMLNACRIRGVDRGEGLALDTLTQSCSAR